MVWWTFEHHFSKSCSFWHFDALLHLSLKPYGADAFEKKGHGPFLVLIFEIAVTNFVSSVKHVGTVLQYCIACALTSFISIGLRMQHSVLSIKSRSNNTFYFLMCDLVKASTLSLMRSSIVQFGKICSNLSVKPGLHKIRDHYKYLLWKVRLKEKETQTTLCWYSIHISHIILERIILSRGQLIELVIVE